MQKFKFFTLEFWLPKIPLLSLIFVFFLPFILININYDLGLFFIAFYIAYWTIRVFGSYHHIFKSYRRLLQIEKTDFSKNELIESGAKNLEHIVIVPIYTEPRNVIEDNVISLVQTEYRYRENITVLLATEARVPTATEHAKYIVEKYKNSGIRIINIVHPENLEGEGKVKGSNITYAIKEYEKMAKLDPKNTFISTIDTDTKVEKKFFSIITATFLATDYRSQAIYQYTPLYSNNWHEGTFFARIIAIGTTLWQFLESQNPEFYRNFAVYGQTLECLHKADYWSRTSIVEDGLQYWRAYFGWNGMFRIIPTPAICEMDLVDEVSVTRTVKSQYKQLRRWSWGCTDVEYVIPEMIKNKKIPFREKFRKTGYLILNHLFWAGGPLMMLFIGYVPGVIYSIDQSLAAFTVPIATSIIFTILVSTVIIPSLLSIHIMRRYVEFRWYNYIFNFFQWLALPFLTLTMFSIPALESQIRLFFNKRIDGFDTTQKMERKSKKS